MAQDFQMAAGRGGDVIIVDVPSTVTVAVDRIGRAGLASPATISRPDTRLFLGGPPDEACDCLAPRAVSKEPFDRPCWRLPGKKAQANDQADKCHDACRGFSLFSTFKASPSVFAHHPYSS
jgi:hypothetical protein